MSRKIKTNNWILFGDMVKYLFCVDCKKRVPGCEPESLELPGTRLENEGKKLKMGLTCRIVENQKPGTVKNGKKAGRR